MSGGSQRPQPPSGGGAEHGKPKYLTGRLGRKLFDDYHCRKEERELYDHFRGIVWNRIQGNGGASFGVSSLLLSDGIGYAEGLLAGAVTVGMVRWRRRHRGSLRLLFGGDAVPSTTAPMEATTFGFGGGRGRLSATSPAKPRPAYRLDRHHPDQPSRPLLLLREGIAGSVAAALVGAACTDTRRVRGGLVGLPLSMELPPPPRRRPTSAENDDPGWFASESSTTTSSHSTITDGLCDDILNEIRLLSVSSSSDSAASKPGDGGNEDEFRRRTGAYRRLINNEQTEVTEETLALRDIVAFAENCRKRQRRQLMLFPRHH